MTVLEVTDSEVVVGNPLGGLDRLSCEDFHKNGGLSALSSGEMDSVDLLALG